MAALVRWHPIREMDRMQAVMDRLFDNALYRPWFGVRSSEAVGSVPVDVHETADEFVIKAPMAGVTSENLEVTYEAGVLTIRGEVPEEKEAQGECLCQERGFGKFARSVSLPGDIVADKIVANLKDGVLTLHLPKAEEIKPRKISVNIS